MELPASPDPRADEPSPGLGTLAVACLVVGVLALLLSPLLVGGLFGLVGLTLGTVRLALSRRKRALAAWGLALSGAGLAASVAAGLLYHRWYRAWEQNLAEAAAAEEVEDYEDATSWAGSRAPVLSLRSIEGTAVDTAALAGRPVIVNFWATWCRTCVKELPHLERLAQEAPDGLTVIGISNEDAATLLDFARKRGLHYPIVSDDDPPPPYDGVAALPTTVFIDRRGMIASVVVGYQGYDDLRAGALAASAGQGP